MIYEVYFDDAQYNPSRLAKKIKSSSKEDKFIFIITNSQKKCFDIMVANNLMQDQIEFTTPRPLSNVNHIELGRRLHIIVMRGGA
jgi:hypothetical protein